MVDLSSTPARERRNVKVALMLAGFVALMVGVAYAAVPLYQMLCQAIGLDGTTQVDVNFGTGTARSGIAHFPKVVFFVS